MTHPLPDKAVEAGARGIATAAHTLLGRTSSVLPSDMVFAEACLSALAAEGLVVVPREATQAMLDAIVTYPAELVAARNDPAYIAQMQAATLAERALAAQRYRAMIEAAREG